MPMLAKLCPKLAKLCPKSAKFGRTRPKSDRIWPEVSNIDELRLTITKSFSKFGRHLANISQFWPKLANPLSTSASSRPNFSSIGKCLPNLGSQGNCSTALGPATAARSQVWDHGVCLSRRNSAGAHPSRLDQCSTRLDLTKVGFAEI